MNKKTAVPSEHQKPRTVLMLDPELDDQNTLIRYLLYSDHFQTEGLIYQSSIFHWKGDGKGTAFAGNSEHTRLGYGPQTNWRWDEGTRFMEEAVEIYASVYQNLSVHSDGYPDPDDLRAKIFEGNVEFPGDMSKDSPGSNHIKSLMLDEKPGKLYLLTGAGQSTIGRALKSIEEQYKATDQWEQIYRHICSKVIIQSFADQDGVYPEYIGPNWPDIEFREMSTKVWGYLAPQVVQPEDQQYLSAAWMRQHVSEVGPFGSFYRVWGDGKRMHQHDITDFFGHAGLTVEQLTELGYSVWFTHLKQELGEAGSWISEGDTSIFMNLLNNGLDGHVNSSYGGWGGRNGKDIDPSGKASKDYAAARWFGAAQRDFAARMKWSVTPNYEGANHAPVVELISPVSKNESVRPGQKVVLQARVHDPDGDHVTAKWWRYSDADTYPGEIELLPHDHPSGSQESEEKKEFPVTLPDASAPKLERVIKPEITSACEFIVPYDAADGQTIHVIIEATDNGTPALTSYQRIVLTVSRVC